MPVAIVDRPVPSSETVTAISVSAVFRLMVALRISVWTS
jgi:hypothetical protein